MKRVTRRRKSTLRCSSVRFPLVSLVSGDDPVLRDDQSQDPPMSDAALYAAICRSMHNDMATRSCIESTRTDLGLGMTVGGIDNDTKDF